MKVPDIRLATEFPTSADRAAGTFNPKAAAWANSARTMAADMDAAAKATQTNAAAAAANVGAIAGHAAAASAAAIGAESARARAVQAEAAIERALIDGPVLQVNGQTGVVALSAADVGAVAEMEFLARMHAASLLF